MPESQYMCTYKSPHNIEVSMQLEDASPLQKKRPQYFVAKLQDRATPSFSR